MFSLSDETRITQIATTPVLQLKRPTFSCFSFLLLLLSKCVNYIFFSASSSHLYADPLSVLSAAAGRGRMEVCGFLLERGAVLELSNRRGVVPLLCATKHGHTQVRGRGSDTQFPSFKQYCFWPIF